MYSVFCFYLFDLTFSFTFMKLCLFIHWASYKSIFFTCMSFIFCLTSVFFSKEILHISNWASSGSLLLLPYLQWDLLGLAPNFDGWESPVVGPSIVQIGPRNIVSLIKDHARFLFLHQILAMNHFMLYYGVYREVFILFLAYKFRHDFTM